MEQKLPTNITMVVKVIFGYMIAMHLLLPVIVFFLYPAKEGAAYGFGMKDLFPADLSYVPYLCAAIVGIMTFFAGFIVPKIIGRLGAARVVSAMAGGTLRETSPVAQSFAPYLIRLVFFETTTLAGFVAAFVTESPQYILPFTVLGILGAIMSPPTESFLRSMTE
jgi:hypothetical protein